MPEAILSYSLSPQQQRLAVQAKTAKSMYQGLALLINGPVNDEVLHDCLLNALSSHDVFEVAGGDGELLHWIEEEIPACLVDDLPRLSSLQMGHVSGNGASVVAKLLRFGKDRYLFQLVVDTRCADTQTLRLIVEACASAYSNATFAEAEIGYSQFVEWQSGLLEDDTQGGRAYWAKVLHSQASTLRLPYEINSSGAADYKDVAETVPDDLRHGLLTFAGTHEASLEDALLTLWGIVLGRVTESTDVMISVASACRQYGDLEKVVGPVAKWLPVQFACGPDASFEQMLEQVTQERRRHDEWAEYFDCSASASIAGFEFEDWTKLPSFGATSINLLERSVVDVGQPLLLRVIQSDGSLKLQCTFDSCRIQESGARDLLGQLLVLMEGARRDSTVPVSKLPLAASSHYQLVANRSNETNVPIEAKLVHELIEEQAILHPLDIAVEYEGKHLTYRELDEQANRLARYLKKRGVSPEQRVGVCLERSLEMVVSLLGILKSGGAYVPLDPDYPPERLQYMARDCEMVALVTTKSLQHHVTKDDISTIVLDVESDQIRQEDYTSPGVKIRPENISYVIYTSGSTGKPKGAMNIHSGLLNRLLWMQARYRLDSTDKILQKTPFSFDVSVWEFFWPLMVGARLVMLRPGAHQDRDQLTKAIQEWGITTLHFVPSMLRAWLDGQGVEGCTTLRRIICSGEELSFELQEKLHARNNATLHNLYGPTEASIDVTSWECQRQWNRSHVPIGQPIWNTQCHVLDESMNPVPAGVKGELYLGGAGLARGYVNQSALTAEKFVPDPFSTEIGRRLYRTGDRASWNPDGYLGYHGRLDSQVKIRGVRIELGEVESRIRKHPNVENAVVVVRTGHSGSTELAAFVVWSGGHCSVGDLRRYLAEFVPPQMIPSRIVALKAFPLTSSGKIDRLSLASSQLPEQPGTWRNEWTATQEIVAQAWRDGLDTADFGLDHNFFEVGGHSILAMQLVSRLRTVFRMDIELSQVLRKATVRGMAEEVERLLHANPKETAEDIGHADRSQPLQLSYGQQRLWFLQQLSPNSSVYNLAATCTLVGPFHMDAFRFAVDQVLQRHDVLRTRYVVKDGEPVQMVDRDSMAIQEVDLTTFAPEQQQLALEKLREEYESKPFDLSSSVVRIAVAHLGPEEQQLFLVVHHVAADGRSFNILLRELETLYTNVLNGDVTPLPALAKQYADFAAWQRRKVGGQALAAGLAYWKKQLLGTSALELSTDFPRPPVLNYKRGTASVRFGKELSNKIAGFARRETSSLFMAVLALYKVFLYRLTDQRDICVGSPISLRSHRELEPLIGFFVNTVALRTSLKESHSLRQVLATVRNTAIDAYSHQEVPFEKVVEAVQPDRDLSRTPLFQTMLAFQPERHVLQIPGLSVGQDRFTGQNGNLDDNAGFDLTLSVLPSAEGLEVVAYYNQNLWAATTMERLLHQFETLSEGALSQPDLPISALAVIPLSQQAEILERACGIATGEVQWFAHHAIEKWAHECPDSLAISYGDNQVSYRELMERSNQLTRALLEMGAGPETVIALLMPRSPELVSSMLATLKAGAAFLPLDIETPAERLAYELSHIGAAFVLTDEARVTELAAKISQPVFAISSLASHVDAGSRLAIDRVAAADAAAYVIFTSGSTGKPKAVIISHRGLRNLIVAQQEAFNASPLTRCMQFASPGFDACISEVFVTLASGGALMIPQEKLLAGRGLERFLQEQSINLVTLPPTVVESLTPEELPYLRTLVMAGEDLPPGLASRWSVKRKVLNAYGPTEASVCATMHECLEGERSSPIGTAIPNAFAIVLDSGLMPVPPGVPGELYIAGPGLARGYGKDPQQTATRFLPNPFQKSGGRMYRTGDLAQLTEEGDIEFLGRKDRQVKLRGFRIELEEIEHVLRSHEAVLEAVVTVQEYTGIGKVIRSHITMRSDSSASIDDVRKHLQTLLPSYMVPSSIQIVPEMPRLMSGKIDVKALPTHEPMKPRRHNAPVSQSEQMLVAIWKEALQVEEIGTDDNFFELGGHSMLLVSVQAQLQQKLDREIPIVRLFEYPTVRALAQYLDTNETESIDAEAVRQREQQLLRGRRQQEYQRQRRIAKALSLASPQ